ncbi:hypothetical protein [Paraburkholderia caffeinilytica]|uniref:hypothetical protein n=1 Tax=Paraburkholderia caffeinilytica TaxID=1761016 RepID=UPI0038BA5623
MQIEEFATSPLDTVIPTYVYGQFSDDPDIQAFFAGLNTTAQGYVDWFLQTPLSVYTSPNINGPLLDWIGQGIYGIERPVISTLSSRSYGAYNTLPYNTRAYGTRQHINSGTAESASDDIYKRTLTWYTYLGDGRQMSVEWLRRRVARFLFGANGSDIPADYFWQVGISRSSTGFTGSFGSAPYNTQAYGTRKTRKNLAARSLTIAIPAGQNSQIFQALFNEGYLAVPFQVRFTVVIIPAPPVFSLVLTGDGDSVVTSDGSYVVAL